MDFIHKKKKISAAGEMNDLKSRQPKLTFSVLDQDTCCTHFLPRQPFFLQDHAKSTLKHEWGTTQWDVEHVNIYCMEIYCLFGSRQLIKLLFLTNK